MHTKSENKYKLKRLNLSFTGLFFQPYFQGFANPEWTTLTVQGLFANKWGSVDPDPLYPKHKVDHKQVGLVGVYLLLTM
jgi:hypothetical protein